jgi:hypothetical protein
VVTGLAIRKVVFSIGGRTLASRTRSPFDAVVKTGGGIHTLTARVTFTDATAPATLHVKVKACAAAKRAVRRPAAQPPRTPSGFTG